MDWLYLWVYHSLLGLNVHLSYEDTLAVISKYWYEYRAKAGVYLLDIDLSWMECMSNSSIVLNMAGCADAQVDT